MLHVETRFWFLAFLALGLASVIGINKVANKETAPAPVPADVVTCKCKCGCGEKASCFQLNAP